MALPIIAAVVAGLLLVLFACRCCNPPTSPPPFVSAEVPPGGIKAKEPV